MNKEILCLIDNYVIINESAKGQTLCYKRELYFDEISDNVKILKMPKINIELVKKDLGVIRAEDVVKLCRSYGLENTIFNNVEAENFNSVDYYIKGDLCKAITNDLDYSFESFNFMDKDILISKTNLLYYYAINYLEHKIKKTIKQYSIVTDYTGNMLIRTGKCLHVLRVVMEAQE